MCCVVKKLASTKLSAPRASRSLRSLKEGDRYIERPADAALLRTLQSGEHAYVLAARQTGKSSLLRRTQDKLVTQGYRCIKLDMGAFSFERSVSQWYLSLAREIARGLRQPRDFAETLLAQDEGHPASRRFFRFLQEVLRLSDAPLVIFLDEVEGFLQMPRAVAADFLATLRSYVDDRDSTPPYRRLCLCLMGACTSAELVPGAQRTPFDIAREITLTDFDWPSVRSGLLPFFAKKGPQSEAAAKLTGHFRYYGVVCNEAKLSHFRWSCVGALFRWLNRRSQKHSFTWERFEQRLRFHPLPHPPCGPELIDVTSEHGATRNHKPKSRMPKLGTYGSVRSASLKLAFT